MSVCLPAWRLTAGPKQLMVSTSTLSGWTLDGFQTWLSSLQSGMLAIWWEMLLNPSVTDVQCTNYEM